MGRYTVYSVLGDGNPWDVLSTDSPEQALNALDRERNKYAKHRDHHHDVYLTDDPEAGSCESLLMDLGEDLD